MMYTTEKLQSMIDGDGSLDLWGTQITDLAPLAGLIGLQRLNLEDTQITDITPLAGLTGLQSLWLGGTQITDLAPLAGMTGLQSLNLWNTQITEEQIATFKAKVPNCKVYK